MGNVSRRKWKEGNGSKPVSSLNATKESKTSFAMRREKQKKLQAVKELAQELKKDADMKKEQQRKSAEEVKKQREENRAKSVKVQIVKDARKIKRMGKRQLIKSRFYLKGQLASSSAVHDR
eukprot:TRINITY_DN58378_c0_g1_i1.p2 TRINITY_DN58378_c0_g1~~TRINITY_DN58378_c0_g1_i1.p2  ORF type:complete len:137 (+),score=76.10 TRINITY_DN58378_c0_g1_i1:49-411(+)